MGDMLATPDNMAKLATIRTPGARLFAYSPRTFEEYSATAGDYWDRPGDEPLKDANGEPMVLAYKYEAIQIVADTAADHEHCDGGKCWQDREPCPGGGA